MSMKPKKALMRNRKKTLFPTFLLNRLLFCVNQFHHFKKMCQFSSLSPSVPHHSNFFLNKNIVQQFKWLGKNPICEFATIKIQFSIVVKKSVCQLMHSWKQLYFHHFGHLFLLLDKPKEIIFQANERKAFFLCFVLFVWVFAFWIN